MSENLLTIPEFAASLRVRPSCIRRWISESKVTFVHVAASCEFPQAKSNGSSQQGRIGRRPLGASSLLQRFLRQCKAG